MEPPDHVRRIPEVLPWQLFALFSRVSLLLDSVAKRVLAVRTLEDLLVFVLLVPADLDRWRQLGRAMPVGYVRLK